MPTTATPLSKTASAVSRRVIPPVNMSGSGLVSASSAARSRKYASRATVRSSAGRPDIAGLS
jgi:hypothetical protein